MKGLHCERCGVEDGAVGWRDRFGVLHPPTGRDPAAVQFRPDPPRVWIVIDVQLRPGGAVHCGRCEGLIEQPAKPPRGTR